MSLPMNVNGDSDIVLMILMFVHLFLVLSWRKKLNMFFLKKESGSIYILIWDLFHRFI